MVERDAQGRALRFAGMHRDITRRKEAEALLRKAMGQAGKSRAIGRAGLSQHSGSAAANDD